MRAAWWSLFLLLVAFVPAPVAAQATATPVLEWELPEGPLALEPLTEVDLEAVLRVSCATGSATSAAPWSIQIGVEADEGVVVTFRPATVHVVVDPVACASGEVLASEPVVLSIQVHHSVPGGTTTDVVLTAQEGSQEEPTTEPLSVEVGPFFNHQVQLDHAIHKVQPGEPVRLHVLGANFGNVDLLLKPSVGEGTSNALTPTWENEWLLRAGQEETFVVNVATGGGGGVYENRRDTLDLEVGAVWADDPSTSAETVHLTAVVQQQGSPALESPAPLAPALVLVVLALLAALRRR